MSCRVARRSPHVTSLVGYLELGGLGIVSFTILPECVRLPDAMRPEFRISGFHDDGFPDNNLPMAKGYELHQARMMALQGMGKDLARRAKSKCEITGAAGVSLSPYEIPPVGEEPDIDRILLVSEDCREALEKPKLMAGRTWQCLAEAVWSENPAVQVVAWRMLNELAKREDWAREVLEEVFLDPEVEAWARAGGI